MSRDSSVGKETDYGLDIQRSIIGQGLFLFSLTSILALGPHSLLFNVYRSPGGKAAEA